MSIEKEDFEELQRTAGSPVSALAVREDKIVELEQQLQEAREELKRNRKRRELDTQLAALTFESALLFSTLLQGDRQHIEAQRVGRLLKGAKIHLTPESAENIYLKKILTFLRERHLAELRIEAAASANALKRFMAKTPETPLDSSRFALVERTVPNS
eukprot:gnl/Chilomastix_cuspidata/4520.p1 GENE.gnl/Chilomastix_cuspidata/4520~~gnl/Chilomastix_cuspidata/4520.p1  ORF type:complete len:158 (-),score=22.67 gnl/Chilomastix_cuspidata/4520:75-548(-)